VHDRDHSGGAIQRDCETERGPSGDACGIGTPPAEPGAGLAAGEEPGTLEPAATACGLPAASQGRQEAAGRAGQERGPVRVDAAHDDLPLPIGQRISRPAAAPERPRQARKPRQGFPEDHREPNAWSGPAEEARRRMMAWMDEQRRRDAIDAMATRDAKADAEHDAKLEAALAAARAKGGKRTFGL
jgi:hypothetical protein